MAAVVTLLAVAVGLLGVLVVGLLRAHAEVIRSLHDLGVNLDPSRSLSATGSEAPPGPQRAVEAGTGAFDLVGDTPAGDLATVAVRGSGRLTLIVFLSSSCLTCRGFWKEFADPNLAMPGAARPVLVTKSADQESLSAVQALAPAGILTLLSSEAWAAYGVPVAPYFVLVDGATERVVGEGAATTWKQMRNLIDQALADAALGADRTSTGRATQRRRQTGSERAARIDEALGAAGIEPGDPSLYPRESTPPW